jgi:hypothetical protein
MTPGVSSTSILGTIWVANLPLIICFRILLAFAIYPAAASESYRIPIDPTAPYIYASNSATCSTTPNVSSTVFFSRSSSFTLLDRCDAVPAAKSSILLLISYIYTTWVPKCACRRSNLPSSLDSSACNDTRAWRRLVITASRECRAERDTLIALIVELSDIEEAGAGSSSTAELPFPLFNPIGDIEWGSALVVTVGCSWRY